MIEFILELLQENLATILTGLLGLILAGGFGVKFKKYKKVAKEGLDVLNAVIESLEDDQITDDEVGVIVKEAKEFINEIKKKEA